MIDTIHCGRQRRALIAFVLTLVVAVPGLVHAIDGHGDVRLYADYAAYRLGPDSPDAYVEFYFELKRSDFTFRTIDDRMRADVYTWVHIADTTGAPVDSVGGAFVSVVRDSLELADSNFTMFFARMLVLPPGDYQAEAVVVDLESKASSEANFPIHVPAYTTDTLMLSQVEFGYDVVNLAGDTTVSPMDVLVKNGQKVYPDCRGLVGTGRPRLFFYSEIYNLDFDPGRENSYEMVLSFIPNDSTPVIVANRQTLTKPGRDAVLATGVNMRDVPLGAYDLRIDITDLATGQTASTEKPFWRVAPPLDSLSPEDEQRVREIIAYIARPEEMERFDRLNPVGKRNFLIQFWKERDPTPETPENEFKEEHFRRLNYANEKYSVGYGNVEDGWRTDMGRVYIIYGPPSHTERFPFTPERPAAEQWFYDHLSGQGQVYFLFIDENGYGEYNMVHSTARGERRDPHWEDLVNSGAFERTQ